LQDIGQTRRGPDGSEVPDILAQSINVVARVKNNETIVLGGLNRKSDVGSTARFPILSDLPIIGQFFKAGNRDRNNSELLIFVTPSVVEDDDPNGIGP
jgi:type II secretory pathway component GspD/PulD (secretin)